MHCGVGEKQQQLVRMRGLIVVDTVTFLVYTERKRSNSVGGAVEAEGESLHNCSRVSVNYSLKQ